MIRTALVLIPSLGLLLGIAFSATAVNHLLLDLGSSMEPGGIEKPGGNGELGLSPYFAIGEAGLIIFGIGIFTSAALRRTSSTQNRLLLLGATFLFAVASLAIGMETFVTWEAFGRLASSEAILVEEFVGPLKLAQLPMYLGWGCAFLASLLVGASTFLESEWKCSFFSAPSSISFGCISLLVLTASYGLICYFNLAKSLGSADAVSPDLLAGAISGLLLAKLGLVVAFAIAAVTMLVVLLGLRNQQSEFAEPAIQ